MMGVMPGVYASELSITPFGVANPVAITITFRDSTGVSLVGLASDDNRDLTCGTGISAPYAAGTPFSLGGASPRVAYFNGYVPWIANDLELCLYSTRGTITLDGVFTDKGECGSLSGCYSYTCDELGGSITGITQITPFTATCA